MELIVHYLCPFALRAVYTKNFKGIECETREADLVEKPAFLLEVNPLGKVPALKITIDSQTFRIYESLKVMEYFDSFEGPPLYPRLSNGSVDVLKKVIIDVHIKHYIDGWVMTLMQFLRKTPTKANSLKSIERLKIINDKFLSSGSFFMTNVIGYNQVTAADIALYPFIERIEAIQHFKFGSLFEGDFGHLWEWYDRMSSFEWIKKSKNPRKRIEKIYEMMEKGSYKGLQLPLSRFD